MAFTTADELRRHLLQQHSALHAALGPGAARPMHRDIQFVRRPAGAAAAPPASAGAGARGGRRRGSGRPQDVRFRDAEAAGGAGNGGGGGIDRPPPRGFAPEYDGGHAFIDDDLGMLHEYDPFPAAHNNGGHGGHGGHGGGGFGGQWAGRQQPAPHGRRAPQEDFPSLAAAAAESVAALDLGGGGDAGARGGPPWSTNSALPLRPTG